MFPSHSSIFSFSRRALTLGALCLVDVAAVGTAARAQNGVPLVPKVKVKAGAPELGQAILDYLPDPNKRALDDCSGDETTLNQYVITEKIPTSITVVNGNNALVEWVRQHASWNLVSSLAARPIDEVVLSGTSSVVPQHNTPLFLTPGAPTTTPRPDTQTPAVPTSGLWLDIFASDTLSSTSNQGWKFPSDNEGFGVKILQHIVDDGTTQSQDALARIALFYPASGTQHPDGGPKGYYYGVTGTWAEVSTPNWFYYYDKAWKNPWGIEIRYSANSQSQYRNGDDFVWIGTEAHGSRDYTYLFGRPRSALGSLDVLQTVGYESARGIDTYARIVSHECTHKRCYEHLQEADVTDEDGDGVPDDWEAQVGLRSDRSDSLGWVDLVQTELPSYTEADGDDEVFARMYERQVSPEPDKEKDWADDGLNWKAYRRSPPNRCERVMRWDINNIPSELTNVEWPSLP